MSWVVSAITLIVTVGLVIGFGRKAASSLAAAESDAPIAPIASAANENYCTPQLRAIVQRVASACGLVEGGGRGCKPADAKSVAAMSSNDFNALFLGLQNRAHLIQYDSEQQALDAMAMAEVDETWADKRGASFFFVVARASPDGDAAANARLSQARANSVLDYIKQKFPGDDDVNKVGLLWLGEDFAQLDEKFCEWNRSRAGQTCTKKDINRSAFVAWIDCAI